MALTARSFTRLSSAYRIALMAMAGLIVSAAVLGGVRNYSPVPFWDMWNGYLDFFMRVSDGDRAAWWVQHNEHRIFLSRLLFWLDLRFFDGNGVILIVANYVLVAMGALVFCLATRRVIFPSSDKTLKVAAMALIWGAVFFWSQENNLTWGFQSQFVLAQLLPMCALYVLSGAHPAQPRSMTRFVLACALGLAACGTMANGVLALPLMCVYAVTVGLPPSRILALVALTAITVVGYYSGYSTGAGHLPLLATLRSAPLGVIEFVLAYLGSPVSFIPRRPTHGIEMSMVAGAIMVVTAIIITLKQWALRRERRTVFAMLAFIAYVGVTAVGTALGRIDGGLAQALASRYTTPALMAWAALLVASLPLIVHSKRRRLALLVLAPCVFVALANGQEAAVLHREQMRFQREAGALALALDVRDETTIGQIFPNTDWAMAIASKARDRHLSVFGQLPLKDARALLGTVSGPEAPGLCSGMIESAEIVGPGQLVRVQGKITRLPSARPYERLELVDTANRVVGIAVDGLPEKHRRTNDPGDARQTSGFLGYVRPTAMMAPITLVTGMGCSFKSAIPVAAFSAVTQVPTPGKDLVESNALTADSTFMGRDFEGSRFVGMRVLGSIVKADADIGSVTFHMHLGQHIFFRTGPTTTHQTLAIAGIFPCRPMPVFREWTRLTFDDPRLPDEFDVTLSDNGTRWGEWSAIAVSDGALP